MQPWGFWAGGMLLGAAFTRERPVVMPLKHFSCCAFETTNSWLKVQRAVSHACHYWGTFSPHGSDTAAPDLSPLLFFSQSSVCSKIVQLLGQNEVDYRQKQVVIVSQDSFYRVLTSEQKSKALKGQFNFDHPGEWRTAPGLCRADLEWEPPSRRQKALQGHQGSAWGRLGICGWLSEGFVELGALCQRWGRLCPLQHNLCLPGKSAACGVECLG